MPRARRDRARSGADASTLTSGSTSEWPRRASRSRPVAEPDHWLARTARARHRREPRDRRGDRRGARGGGRARRARRARRRGAASGRGARSATPAARRRRCRPTSAARQDVERLFDAVERIGPARGARLRRRRADARAVHGDDDRRSGSETLAVNLTGAFLCARAAFAAMRRRRRGTDRQHRVAVGRVRDREVPRPGRLQRLQVRRRRSDRGDRGRGQGARHQRDLHQPGRGRHRDAAPRQP